MPEMRQCDRNCIYRSDSNSQADKEGIKRRVTIAPEEIAFINGWIDSTQLRESAKAYGKSPYGEHLKAVAEGKVRY